jgi:hypothetical protein
MGVSLRSNNSSPLVLSPVKGERIGLEEEECFTMLLYQKKNQITDCSGKIVFNTRK